MGIWLGLRSVFEKNINCEGLFYFLKLRFPGCILYIYIKKIIIQLSIHSYW